MTEDNISKDETKKEVEQPEKGVKPQESIHFDEGAFDETIKINRHQLRESLLEEEQQYHEGSVTPTELDQSKVEKEELVGPSLEKLQAENQSSESTEKMNAQEKERISRQHYLDLQKEEDLKKYPFYQFPSSFFGGFFRRMLAYLIDLFAIFCLQTIIVAPWFKLKILSEIIGIFPLKATLSVIVFLAYFILLTRLNHGQTLGKMILGLRVVSLSTDKLTWETVLIREGFGRYIMKTFWILYVFLFTEKRQDLADYFADTAVVQEEMIFAFQMGKKEPSKTAQSVSE